MPAASCEDASALVYNQTIAMYLDSNACLIFPGSAGVSPAQVAARMAALPGYRLQEHNGIKSMFRYVAPFPRGEGTGAWPKRSLETVLEVEASMARVLLLRTVWTKEEVWSI
jgi:hypothetical protein